MTAMMIAKRTFTFTDRDGSHGEVTAGERIVADHALVGDFPDEFREQGLADELKIRSDWLAHVNERAARPAGRTPVSEAGKREAQEADFWRASEALLERTRDDQPTAEERRPEDFYSRALQQIEDSDAARMRDERIALNEAWHGRLAD